MEWTMSRPRLNKHLAIRPGVQAALQTYVTEAAGRARTDLKAHRHEGHARIEVRRGRVDRYLILSDERGQKAAMSIEFGRSGFVYTDKNGNSRFVGPMEGLFILHKAMGLGRR